MLLDRRQRRGWWLDACAIYVLAVILIFPLFRVKYLDNWGSIEPTFIAEARLLQENWGHHLWQPLWYLGTRADYVYPPGLRDGVAMLSWALHSTPAKAYHIFIALLYAFGIVGVYLWVRTVSGSRGAAWLAAVGVALVSPCLLLFAEWRADSPFFVPLAAPCSDEVRRGSAYFIACRAAHRMAGGLETIPRRQHSMAAAKRGCRGDGGDS